ncbi:MAG: ECF transporter S component [Clostridia bacterium]|nr:ECF transporter S component [Clostridia bacterium]
MGTTLKRNNVKTVRKLTVTAIMSALSFALMMIEFSVPIMPAFIKFDFSELPALITAFAYGPVYGVLVCLLKNALHLPMSSTQFVGELSNFLMGAVFVFVAGLFYKIKRNRGFALIGSIVGNLAMAVACFVVNYFITYPIYMEILIPEQAILGMYQAIMPSMDSILKAILVFNVPFTFVKGLASVGITFLIYRKISPLLKGKNLG